MSIPIEAIRPGNPRIQLGRRGEQEARILRWTTQLPKWRDDYGEGTVVLLHRRQGDVHPYPVEIRVEGNNIDWLVTAVDTAREGPGLCELQYVVGDTVVKTERWETLVRCSLEKPGPAPEPSGGWVQQMVAQTDAAVAAGLEALQEAGTAGLEELQEAGETARAAVEQARSQAEQQLAGMAQSYSKGESDGRYLPVESALTVSASGDDLVTLSPTVPWALQGLKLFGRTVQDGVPSPDSPVPLMSAGEDGTLVVTACGVNLFDPSGVDVTTADIFMGSGPITWSPYTGQTITISTPSGLPGIPVTSGGNYTDQSGQQWICDESDLLSGTITSNLEIVNASELAWAVNSVWTDRQETNLFAYAQSAYSGMYSDHVMSNVLKSIDYTASFGGVPSNSIMVEKKGDIGTIYVCVAKSLLSSVDVDGLMSFFQQYGVTILRPKAQPSTSQIQSAEIPQSYSGTTTIICDGVGIQGTAVADSTQYIANLSQRIAVLESERTQI